MALAALPSRKPFHALCTAKRSKKVCDFFVCVCAHSVNHSVCPACFVHLCRCLCHSTHPRAHALTLAGSDCIAQFEAMHECFNEHADFYASDEDREQDSSSAPPQEEQQSTASESSNSEAQPQEEASAAELQEQETEKEAEKVTEADQEKEEQTNSTEQEQPPASSN